MGSDKHYPQEAPAHHVTEGFWIDQYVVTNEEFRNIPSCKSLTRNFRIKLNGVTDDKNRCANLLRRASPRTGET
jgi:formylglycine-generating enzyme required for sulfatase activity